MLQAARARGDIVKSIRSIVLLIASAGMAVAQESPVAGLILSAGPANGAFIERNGKLLAVHGDPSGSRRSVEMVLLTHSPRERTFRAEPRMAEGFAVASAGPVRIAARADGEIGIKVAAPAGAAPGILRAHVLR